MTRISQSDIDAMKKNGYDTVTIREAEAQLQFILFYFYCNSLPIYITYLKNAHLEQMSLHYNNPIQRSRPLNPRPRCRVPRVRRRTRSSAVVNTNAI